MWDIFFFGKKRRRVRGDHSLCFTAVADHRHLSYGSGQRCSSYLGVSFLLVELGFFWMFDFLFIFILANVYG